MNKSIYESIKEATVDGQLPDDYSLPDLTDGEGSVSFVDGALDGITMYHMPPFEMTESAVPGISTLDKRIDILLTYLEKAQKHALCAEDYQVIHNICQYGETVNAAEVSQLAKDILDAAPDISPNSFK